ncbi:MAG: endopeptidase La [bacterium]
MDKEEEIIIPPILPILPLREVVVFPFMIVPLPVGRKSSIKLIDEAVVKDKMIGLFTQINSDIETPTENDIYKIGTCGLISKMMKVPNGELRILIQGLKRIRYKATITREPYIVAEIEIIEEIEDKNVKIEALKRSLLGIFKQIVELTPHLPEEAYLTAINIDKPGKLADFIATNINISNQERQAVLELLNIEERMRKVSTLASGELEILKLSSKITSEVKGEMDKAQREYFLRQQLKAIQKELGMRGEAELELEELRKQIEEKALPDEVRAKALDELERLVNIPTASAEYIVARTYLDWIRILPWLEGSEDKIDIDEARKILDHDHYDLDEVKERILEFLAVKKLKEEMHGPILCFIGPPGTGKTSMGRSIARAMGRKFVRMSLGGIHDEAEIRGHRRTYVGALPGRIIQGIREAGTNNPVFMLDEIDKVGKDFRGDPSSALLEVLDPEQNFSFRDNYLDLPFNLSKVMFITTGNIIDTIIPALRDRMEILTLPGYTLNEKMHIARKHILPKQLTEHGLTKKNLVITTSALNTIIREYTREAGLRNLERMIARICRKTAVRVVKEPEFTVKVDRHDLTDFLGPERFHDEFRERKPQVGVATGLAYTMFGGTIIFVEATMMKGKGVLTLTGQLGDVMRESAVAAMSYIRANAEMFHIKDNIFSTYDFHIHIPEGAVPKDGPSAGITLATALVSLLTNRPVRCNVAMTGEITLRGKILPVGGLKEKCLSAVLAGVKEVILPKGNENNVETISDEIKSKLIITFEDKMSNVFRRVLLKKVKVKEK